MQSNAKVGDAEVTLPVSLRDWFAGMAMQSWLANSYIPPLPDKMGLISYEYADGMLKARNQ